MKAKILYQIITMLKSTEDELRLEVFDNKVFIKVICDVEYIIQIIDDNFEFDDGTYTIMYSNILRILQNSTNDMTIQMTGTQYGLAINLNSKSRNIFFDCPCIFSTDSNNYDIDEESMFTLNLVEFKQSCKSMCNSSDKYKLRLYDNGLAISTMDATLSQIIQIGEMEGEFVDKVITNAVLQRLLRIPNGELSIGLYGLTIVSENSVIFIHF